MRRILSLVLIWLLVASAPAFAQQSGGFTQSAVTCTTSNTPLLPANAATYFILAAVPATASTGVWFDWVGAGAQTSPPSEYVAPGNYKLWGAGGFLPKLSSNCISASSVAITLEYR